MTDFEALIQRLDVEQVRYVIVGEFAGTVLGSPRVTVDLEALAELEALRDESNQ